MTREAQDQKRRHAGMTSRQSHLKEGNDEGPERKVGRLLQLCVELLDRQLVVLKHSFTSITC